MTCHAQPGCRALSSSEGGKMRDPKDEVVSCFVSARVPLALSSGKDCVTCNAL